MSFRDITGYNTSRDYERLIELARTQSIICIVDYESAVPGLKAIRDVARTTWMCRDNAAPDVSARGIGYIDGFTRNGFIGQCWRSNLEFIEPDLEAKQEPVPSASSL